MEWWMWAVLGLALLMLEMATPGGFYFIFFGASAFLVGALDLLGDYHVGLAGVDVVLHFCRRNNGSFPSASAQSLRRENAQRRSRHTYR